MGDVWRAICRECDREFTLTDEPGDDERCPVCEMGFLTDAWLGQGED